MKNLLDGSVSAILWCIVNVDFVFSEKMKHIDCHQK